MNVLIKGIFPDIGPDPLKHRDLVKPGIEGSLERLRDSSNRQQEEVPDQTALVWRVDIDRTLMHIAWREGQIHNFLSRRGNISDQEFDFVIASPADFKHLPEYSTSIPTGKTIGKQWKRQWAHGWLLGEYVESPEPGMVGIWWRAIFIEGSAVNFSI